MKKSRLTLVSLGLGWMVSLGAVFLLGIFSASAFYRAPSDAERETGLTLKERSMMLAIEWYSDEPVNVAQLKSVDNSDNFPPQLENALRSLLRQNNAVERINGFKQIAGGLPLRKVLVSIKFLQELPVSPGRDDGLSQFVKRWGESDGRSAVAFASGLKTNYDRLLAIEAALQGWSAQNPKDAWAWAVERAKRGGQSADRYLQPVLKSLTRVDRDQALGLLYQIEDEELAKRLGLAVMEEILHIETVREATRWVGSFPENSRESVAVFLAEKWSEETPAEAIDWVSSNLGLDDPKLKLLFLNWAGSDAESAADYVWENSEGGVRNNLLRTIAYEWIIVNGPGELANWLNAHGPNVDLDGAIEELVWATAELDPATALVWGQSISDESERAMIEIRVTEAWLERNPDEAIASGLENLLTTPEAREHFMMEQQPEG